jgi:DNA repair exonuclease SbcCD ATPase subunit
MKKIKITEKDIEKPNDENNIELVVEEVPKKKKKKKIEKIEEMLEQLPKKKKKEESKLNDIEAEYINLLDTSKEITQIIAIADIHIRKDELRMNEYLEVFENFYKEVDAITKQNSNTLIVIAGDLLENRDVFMMSSITLCRDFLLRLMDFCDVIIIWGNHDVNKNINNSRCIVEPIIDVMNSMGKRYKLYLLLDSKVYVYGNLSFGLTTQYNETIKTTRFKEKDNNIKITLYHGLLGGSTMENGKIFDEVKMSSRFRLSDFDKRSDYLIFGDNHVHQFFNKKRNSFYCGSLIQQNFGESLFEHGYVLMNLIEKICEFHKLKSNYGKMKVILKENEKIDLPKNLPKNMELDIYCEYAHQDLIDSFKKELRDKKFNITGEMINIDYSNTKVNTDVVLKDNTRIDLTKLQSKNEIKNLIIDFIKKKNDNLKDKDIKVIDEIISDVIKKSGGSDETLGKKIRNISLKKLIFNNIMIYGEGNVIDFDKFNGKMLLAGNNFSGKSTILDVILFAITCETSRGDVENLEHAGKKFGKGSSNTDIILDVNGDTYEIIRLLSGETNKKYQIFKNGENKTPSSKKTIAKFISENICSYDELVTNSMILQNDICSFVDKNDKDKANYILDMLKLNIFKNIIKLVCSAVTSTKREKTMELKNILLDYTKRYKCKDDSNFDVIVEKINNAIEDNEKVLSEGENEISKIALIIEKANKKIKKLEIDLNKSKESHKILSEIDENKKEKENNLEEIKNMKNKINDVNEKIKDFNIEKVKNELDKCKSRIKKYKKEIDENESKIKGKNFDNLKNMYDKYIELEENNKSIEKENGILKGKIEILEVKDVGNYEENEKYKKIISKISELEKRRKILNDKIKKIKENIKEINNFEELELNNEKYIGKNEEINNKKIKIELLKNSRKEIEDNLSKFNESDYNMKCEKCISRYKKDKCVYEDKIKSIDIEMNLLNNEIEKFKDGEFVKYHNEYEKVNKIIKDNEKINIDIDGLKKDIDVVNSDIKMNENEIELIKEKYNDDLSKNKDIKNKIDEINKKIKTNDIKINQNKAIMKKEDVENYNNYNKVFNEINTKKNKIESYEKDITIKEESINKYNESLKTIDECNSKIGIIETKNIIIGEKISKLNKEIIDIVDEKDIQKEINDLEESNTENKKRYDELKENCIKVKYINDECKNDLKIISGFKNKLSVMEHKVFCLEIISSSLNEDDFINKMLTESILPKIEENVNIWLDIFGHEHIKMKLNVNLNATKLEPSISLTDMKNVPLCMASGFERHMYNFVFRLAVGSLNTLAKFNFMIIDEAFDSADKGNKDNVKKLINKMSGLYKWLLTITHDVDIGDEFDTLLNIEKISDTEKRIVYE